MNATPADVDSYLSTLPDDARQTLEGLRQAIKAIVPDAVESFGYGMPAYKYKGRPLIYIGATKNHCALYGPAVDRHKEALAGYDASRGTVRFPPGKPPPESLLKTLLDDRVGEIEEAAATRKTKKPRP